MVDTTYKYYEQHAQAFFDSTVAVDMTLLYERFLPLVPEGGSILDAGCGSGRDAAVFQGRGYEVTAFDASPSLCKLASAYLGKAVSCMRFEEIAWEGAFDAVWACASLLHVPKSELPSVAGKLIKALKPGGVLYWSFKLGDRERQQDGRQFTDMNADGVRALIRLIDPGVKIETWVTEDQRPERKEGWLNVLIHQ